MSAYVVSESTMDRVAIAMLMHSPPGAAALVNPTMAAGFVATTASMWGLALYAMNARAVINNLQRPENKAKVRPVTHYVFHPGPLAGAEYAAMEMFAALYHFKYQCDEHLPEDAELYEAIGATMAKLAVPLLRETADYKAQPWGFEDRAPAPVRPIPPVPALTPAATLAKLRVPTMADHDKSAPALLKLPKLRTSRRADLAARRAADKDEIF